MKKLLLFFILFACSFKLIAQPVPVYERTKSNIVLGDRQTISHFFMGIPHGTTPVFPSDVPDSVKCGALYYVVNPGVDTVLKVYNCLSGVWEKALNRLSSSEINAALGYTAANDATVAHSAGNNTFTGNNSFNNPIGVQSLVIADGSLYSATGDVLVGNSYPSMATSAAILNTVFGSGALVDITSANSNVAVGNGTLASDVTGNKNTAIGTFAGNSALGDGNVFIGYEAGEEETGSNKLYIANNPVTALIKGDFSANTVTITGKLSGTVAASSSDDYVRVADISSFAGTVSSISTGIGLLGGPITATGTIKADTSVLQTVLNFFPKGDTRYLRSITGSQVNTALGYTAANDAAIVHVTGNETISSGIKTFSVSPVVPDATTSHQAAAFDQLPTSLPPSGTILGDLAGSTWPTLTIAGHAVTYAKFQASSSTDRLVGAGTTGTGMGEIIAQAREGITPSWSGSNLRFALGGGIYANSTILIHNSGSILYEDTLSAAANSFGTLFNIIPSSHTAFFQAGNGTAYSQIVANVSEFNTAYSPDMGVHTQSLTFDGATTGEVFQDDYGIGPQTFADYSALGHLNPLWLPNYGYISTNFARLTSNTFSGAQLAPENIISAGAGTARALVFQTGANARWELFANTTAEGGSNAGSDLSLASYTDAGSFLSTIYTITRSTGVQNWLIAPTILGSPIVTTGSSLTSAQLRAILSDESGTGAALFAGGALGAATATSINNVAFTSPGSLATLVLGTGSTFTTNGTISLWPSASATLVSGTKAVTFAGVSSSNHAYAQMVTPGGTTGTLYKAVCSTNTVTVTAITTAGATVTTDTSTVNVRVEN